MRWILGHLPLTAAVAAMGAAMLSLVEHAHDGRTPATTAWMLGAGIPWGYAVARRLANGTDSPTQSS